MALKLAAILKNNNDTTEQKIHKACQMKQNSFSWLRFLTSQANSQMSLEQSIAISSYNISLIDFC